MNVLKLYKCLPLDKKNVDKYKKNYKALCHIELDNDHKGLLYVYDDDVVGFVNVNDKTKTIEALEVNEDYRRQSIGTNLIKIASEELGAEKSYVHKDNKIAISLYNQNGWKVYNQDEKLYYLKKMSVINEDGTLLIESSQSKERTYKCPYCIDRYTRLDLVNHIDEVHEDMIPEGFTAARVVFNLVNKKDHGTCVICKKETKWNENTWKYERLCSEKCKKESAKIAKQRMVDSYGVTHLLNNPKHQDKMLKGRKISGTYKFADGGVKDYVGSYERKLLEFYDKVLNVPSSDIETPGPVIEYEYNGEKHFWITDLYYIPANLVHDAKDGGDNPNTRDMPEYRAKQKAKEDAIIKANKYNYIRLTNNNFQQLLLILAEIKESLMEETDKDYIIRINEYMSMAGMNPVNHDAEAYIVPYYKNNTFVGTALSTDKYMQSIFRVKDNKLVKGTLDDLEDYTFKIFKYKGKDLNNKVELFMESFNDNIDCDDDFIYESFLEGELISPIQFDCNELLEEFHPFEEEIDKMYCIQESIKYQAQLLNYDNGIFVEDCNGMQIKEDVNGFFVFNERNQCRSSSYKRKDYIPAYIYSLLNSMEV